MVGDLWWPWVSDRLSLSAAAREEPVAAARKAEPSPFPHILMPTYKNKITIQFFDTCYGGPETKRGTTTRYQKLEQATAAAEEYAADRGYPCEGFLCETCKCFHVRMSTMERDIPEDRRWTPANVRAHRARLKAIADAERDAARAAKPAAPERQLSNKKGSQRLRKIRANRIAHGLCGFCGSPATTEFKTCGRCRRKNKETPEASLKRKRLASQNGDSVAEPTLGRGVVGDSERGPAPPTQRCVREIASQAKFVILVYSPFVQCGPYGKRL
jgi:hypothetical protein